MTESPRLKDHVRPDEHFAVRAAVNKFLLYEEAAAAADQHRSLASAVPYDEVLWKKSTESARRADDLRVELIQAIRDIIEQASYQSEDAAKLPGDVAVLLQKIRDGRDKSKEPRDREGFWRAFDAVKDRVERLKKVKP